MDSYHSSRIQNFRPAYHKELNPAQCNALLATRRPKLAPSYLIITFDNYFEVANSHFSHNISNIVVYDDTVDSLLKYVASPNNSDLSFSNSIMFFMSLLGSTLLLLLFLIRL